MDSEAEMQQDHHKSHVVYRDAGTVRGCGRLADAAPTWHALTPFCSRLVHEGVARGQLVLIEEATGREVARLAVRRRAPRRPNRRS